MRNTDVIMLFLVSVSSYKSMPGGGRPNITRTKGSRFDQLATCAREFNHVLCANYTNTCM